MQAKPKLFLLSLALLGLTIQHLATSAAFGQWKESFESKQAVWQIQNWDAIGIGGDEIQHGQTTKVAQNGKASYQFQFQSGPGSEILASYPVPAARIIRELDPELWVKCQKPGVRLLARVVLPETPSPTENGPMRLFLFGQTCKRSMRWTSLGFGKGGLENQLNKRLPVLRQKYGPTVSLRGAYLDMLVLNLYSGPGKQTVWVDSLSINGILPYKENANAVGAEVVAFQQDAVKKKSRFSTDGTVIQKDGNIFVVRAVEYNGERLSELRKLGFNCLWLENIPSDTLRLEALNEKMWLICPPPADIVPGAIDSSYDSVMAWRIGKEPDWGKQGEIKETISKLEKFDYWTGRPVIVRPTSGWAAYSRMSGILSVGREVLGTQFPLSSYGTWIQKRIQQAGSYTPFLADVSLDLPVQIQEQAEAMAGRKIPIPASAQQVRSQVFEAFSVGCRGFVFRSRIPLDQQRPGNNRRRMAAAWVNRQLQQIQPWIAGSLSTGTIPQQQPRLKVYSFKTPRSRLLLCSHVYGQESWTAGDRPDSITVVSAPGAGTSDQAYRLTPTGMIPAGQSRIGSDRMIEIPSPNDWEVIILTQDAAVTRYVKEQSDRAKREWSFHQLFQSMAKNSTEWGSRLHGAMVRSGQDPIEVRNVLTRAFTFRQAIDAAGSGQDLMNLWRNSENVNAQIAKMNRMIITPPQSLFSQPVASPLVLHPMLVPLHWQSLSRFAGAKWSANSLPAGDFENLPMMVKADWQHIKRNSVPASTAVDLTPAAATDGRSGLVITSKRKGNLIPRLLEGAPIEIHSPEIDVPAGHMVEIRGQVRIDDPITGTMEGFQIIDSWGGKPMAHLLHRTNGWKTFVIYRATKEARKLKLSFVLNGFGTVMLDEVTIRQTPIQNNSISTARRPDQLQKK